MEYHKHPYVDITFLLYLTKLQGQTNKYTLCNQTNLTLGSEIDSISFITTHSQSTLNHIDIVHPECKGAWKLFPIKSRI